MLHSLKNKKIWVAGHKGMVGSALLKRLNHEDCTILTVERNIVDLTNQTAVFDWVNKMRPDIVVLAAATVGGYFIFLILRFILDGVLKDIQQQRIFVMALDNRVKTMNNEIIRIDVQLSAAFDLDPDLSRIARADGQKDARKD